MKHSRLHFLWNERGLRHRFRTGVSLHSHTMYSSESLGMVPRYTRRVPILGARIREQERLYLRNKGFALDWDRAFWTPPLHPQRAWRLEREQIERELGAQALVSLSDHDNIEAASLLAIIDGSHEHPVSVEWTIPFGVTFFHLGVHNLPQQRAHALMREMAAYTAAPDRDLLAGLLDELHRQPETLVVLNHPLWDESGAGGDEHNRLLGRLLERHGSRIHALELNGLRSWKENAGVMRLAEGAGMPVLSGGDRHGSEPNAILNLTNAGSFAGFVAEVREGVSEVVVMPQYREPLKLRVLQTMRDIVRDYPDQPHGRKHWNDRIFFRYPDGAVQPLSAIWKGGRGPAVVGQFLAMLRLVENRRIRFALRRVLADRGDFVLET